MEHRTMARRARRTQRLLAAGFFATVLALGAAPLAVAQEDAPTGGNWGGFPVTSHDGDARSFVVNAGSLDEQTPPADHRFLYSDADAFEVTLSMEGPPVEVTADQWGCVLDVIIDGGAQHLFTAQPYDPGASEFSISTSDTGECLAEGGDENGGDENGGDENGGDENGGDENGGDENGGDDGAGDEAEVEGVAVQQPERIDTGGGATAGSSDGAPLLLALLVPAGALAVRRLVTR